MKYEIIIDGSKKAELPGNLNQDKLTEIVKMYLFNVEYEGWELISIARLDSNATLKVKKKVKK